MSKAFFSYRRKDSGSITGRIIDRFKKEIPYLEVFHDIDSIPVGKNFLEYTEEKLSEAEFFIPIIGNSWAKSLKENEDNPNDYVRIEVEQALKAGMYILPVFVEGALCPSPDEIPKSITAISHLNGLPVRSGGDYENDIQNLVDTIKAEINKNATATDVLTNKIKTLNVKTIVSVVLGMIAVAAITYFINSENENYLDCVTHRKATIIAKFSESDDGGLSNSILTKLEKYLPDSMFNVRTTAYQDRDVDSYYNFIRRTYFDNKCDTVGLFVNGYYNEDSKIFNVYTTNVGLKIFHPDYLNKNNIVLDNPKEISFKTEKDAEFLADFIITILMNGSIDTKEALKRSYEFQSNYNLTNENEAKYGSESVLGYIYLMRADYYASEGNDVKAREYYAEAKNFGNNEVKAIAIKNDMKVDDIVVVMDKNPDLAQKRENNFEDHQKIEKSFGDVIISISEEAEKWDNVKSIGKKIKGNVGIGDIGGLGNKGGIEEIGGGTTGWRYNSRPIIRWRDF